MSSGLQSIDVIVSILHTVWLHNRTSKSINENSNKSIILFFLVSIDEHLLS